MITSAAKLLSGISSSFRSPRRTVVYIGTDVSWNKTQDKIKIGLWIVRTMYQIEKIYNTIKEMDRMDIGFSVSVKWGDKIQAT